MAENLREHLTSLSQNSWDKIYSSNDIFFEQRFLNIYGYKRFSFISDFVLEVSMSLKLLRALVSKNDHFTSMLLKQNYCHLFVVRLYHGNYYFHHRMKFNLQDYNAMKQSFLLRQFSASNNQYNNLITILNKNLCKSWLLSFRTEIYFEQICNETLESLSEYFEQIIDNCPQLNNPDITYSVCTLLELHWVCKNVLINWHFIGWSINCTARRTSWNVCY